MGTADFLGSTLFGRTRGALLAILFNHVGESFYLRQLARQSKIALGPVQREIRQLVNAGLVKKSVLGKQVLYSVNEACPVFQEMKGLVAKTVGMHDVLLEALNPLRRKIDLAFVYGSVARSSEREGSDVDVMIVGRIDFDAVVTSLAGAQRILGREINPTVYSHPEFVKKLQGRFLKSILAENKIFLIGDENVLRDMGQE